MNPQLKEYLLKVTKACDAQEVWIIQSLWSGYGKIARYRLTDSLLPTVVVKYIKLSEVPDHPLGWNTNNSHDRKIKSYQVETHWYESWSQFCTDRCRVPQFLGSYSESYNQWIILEDLDTHYPLRKQHLSISEAKICLSWLAHFHATFLNKEPHGLWDIGTYWNLETRPEEFKRMEDGPLKFKAKKIDSLLSQGTYHTIVHGDAKVANFCFSENGQEVAAVDFQYAGGGCGIKDVAYFLGSCLSGPECERYEVELLTHYFSVLQHALLNSSQDINFKELESEWRELYPIACVDFMRFLKGWMPSHRKINQYNIDIMETVLSEL